MRLFGKIPFKVSPFFFVTAAVIGFLYSMSLFGTVIWMGIIFVSVLVHELGHALVSLMFGQSPRIDLVIFGGMTAQEKEKKIKRWKEFLVVLAGPAFGYALSFLALFLSTLAEGVPLLRSVLMITAVINFFWSSINLLPILPLDGGHLVRIIFESVFKEKGWRFAQLTSFAIAALGGVAFLWMQNIFLAIILFLFAFQNLEAYRQMRGHTKADQRDDLKRLLDQAAIMEQSDPKKAVALCQEVRKEARSGFLYQQATLFCAKIFAREGRKSEAYELLLPLQGELSPEGTCLLQQLSFEVRDYSRAVDLTPNCLISYHSPSTALIAALSCVSMGETTQAIRWLQTALEMGVEVETIVHRQEFQDILAMEKFQKILKRYQA